jgi:NitT/TauT family transport system ATP-binding protein
MDDDVAIGARPMQARETSPPSQGGALDVIDGTLCFGQVTAFENVTLRVAPGEFVSVVGPSGCGKTSILNYAAGLLPPSTLKSGSITVFSQKPVVGNKKLGYMLARDSLMMWRTTLKNAEFGAEARGMPEKERRARAMSLLERVGLKGFEDSYPKALSHGMRQRVALARTFCMDADMLLMDEPFGALDAQTKFQLEELLLGLWQESKRTVVFVTHDLAGAIALGDRVVIMAPRPGRVLADVPIDLPRPRNLRELQRTDRFHELYKQVWTTMEEGFGT